MYLVLCFAPLSSLQFKGSERIFVLFAKKNARFLGKCQATSSMNKLNKNCCQYPPDNVFGDNLINFTFDYQESASGFSIKTPN